MALKYVHNITQPADNIVEYIAAHEEALVMLKKQLPIACARDGHVWDNPEGRQTEICLKKGVWIEHDVDPDRGWNQSAGHWAIPPEHADVFQRTCTRCGKVENKKPVQLGVKSPWSNT